MKLFENYSLKNYNTFHIDVTTKKFVELLSIDSASSYFASNNDPSENILLIGSGSNILLTQNYEGTVIHPNITGIKVIHKTDDFVLVESGAGVVWDDLVTFAIENNYGGIENLTSIPGTVGAAPVQNIGAYGVELKDIFHSLNAIEIATGERRKFNLEECEFGYRDSVFKNELKGKYVITKIVLRLSINPELNIDYQAVKEKINERDSENLSIKDVREIIAEIRNNKLPDPQKYGNAGSFFKNPVVVSDKLEELQQSYGDVPHFVVDYNHFKLPAAWLIEKAGLKGKRIGNVGTHVNQPLVIINYGGASGNEILEFSKFIQKEVKNKFAIHIMPEVNII
ncbi:MAG: UDP-N-acetylmuramate dehydrogenase [Bacteroidetes bacterium]|nr:UDP-N-acetylmuramate dehydrogenase [Bacteroidota bacterium]